VFLLAKPSEYKIRQFPAKQAASRFSYSSVGATADEVIPQEFGGDHNRIQLGSGELVWNRAVAAVNSWRMFQLDWTRLCWPDAPIAIGTNVAVLIRHFGFWSLNAARVVYVIDESSGPMRRYGFAYGTLLDHAKSGEERFLVEWHKDDSVWYDIFSFWRPTGVPAMIEYTVGRWLQHRFTTESKMAMVRAVG
jgi:uncharacterized protein (UPF0548 family)